jgi:hypothetical protein
VQREGKKPLGRPRRRWEYNIKMYLREIGWEVMDVNWMSLTQDRTSGGLMKTSYQLLKKDSAPCS